MIAVRPLFRSFSAEEDGSTAIEYGMIAALIVVALLAGLSSVADANSTTYDKLETKIAV